MLPCWFLKFCDRQCRAKQDRQWAERSHVTAAPALIVFSVTPADTSLQY